MPEAFRVLPLIFPFCFISGTFAVARLGVRSPGGGDNGAPAVSWPRSRAGSEYETEVIRVTSDTADVIIERLDAACRRNGIMTRICEQSTRLWVNLPGDRAHLAEFVSLRPDADDRLCFYWLMGGRSIKICSADEITLAVENIKQVLSVSIS
jgi:hypothetical protein